MKKIFEISFKIFIIYALFAGLADVGVWLQHKVRYAVYEQNLAQFKAEQARLHQEEKEDTTSTTRILLLGASQIFGDGLSEEEKIQSYLEKKHPGLQVQNRSMSGETLTQNMVALQEQVTLGTKFDRAFVINGGIDIYYDCKFNLVNHTIHENDDFLHMTRLHFIFTKLFNTHPKTPEQSYCTSDLIQDMVAKNIYSKMEQSIKSAKEIGVDITIILMPIIMDHQTMISLGTDPDRKDMIIFQAVYKRLLNIIDQANNPKIVNMTKTFPSEEGMFRDSVSHLSPDGMAKFSDAFYNRFLK